MSNQIRRSRAVSGEWFYGHEVSDYGKENGYVDYRTLASAFDAVMNNNIMGDLENAGFYFDPVQDGSSDYSDEIDELREAADALRDQSTEKTDAADEAEEAGDAAEAEKLRTEADDLEAEQNPPEIFQFFIVDDAGAEIIQEWTDDPLFYCEALDLYIWGVTHWGTSWDYVLTDIRINAGEEAYK